MHVEHAPILHLEPGSPSWPDLLDHIDGPPARLWARGRLEALAAGPRVAIVGTRSPTPYGADQARRFASELATAGVVVVSGLARGVDQAAHAGALEAGGLTIAVLGSGVDRPWPAGPVTERVAVEGLLLSEYAPGQAPRRHHFPARNRVISGLSSGTVVVEAAYVSGSLITARWAADQGRMVWALPGRVDHPMARGCHRLIREGATLVESAAEVLAELGLADPGQRAGAERSGQARASPVQRALLEGLRGETLTPDELAQRTGRELATVLTALVELELAGAVVRGAGSLYRLAVALAGEAPRGPPR